MIRNIVVGRLNAGVPQSAVEPALAAIAGLQPDGRISCHVGVDLRLRDDSWDFGITSDFVDAAAYQAYDVEIEHNRIRREMFAPLCAQIVRLQLEI